MGARHIEFLACTEFVTQSMLRLLPFKFTVEFACNLLPTLSQAVDIFAKLLGASSLTQQLYIINLEGLSSLLLDSAAHSALGK